jgi:hypothetical protein
MRGKATESLMNRYMSYGYALTGTCTSGQGGTGLWPVRSGFQPDRRAVKRLRNGGWLASVRRPGWKPDRTGWKPVPPKFQRQGSGLDQRS